MLDVLTPAITGLLAVEFLVMRPAVQLYSVYFEARHKLARRPREDDVCSGPLAPVVQRA